MASQDIRVKVVEELVSSSKGVLPGLDFGIAFRRLYNSSQDFEQCFVARTIQAYNTYNVARFNIDRIASPHVCTPLLFLFHALILG